MCILGTSVCKSVRSFDQFQTFNLVIHPTIHVSSFYGFILGSTGLFSKNNILIMIFIVVHEPTFRQSLDFSYVINEKIDRMNISTRAAKSGKVTCVHEGDHEDAR